MLGLVLGLGLGLGVGLGVDRRKKLGILYCPILKALGGHFRLPGRGKGGAEGRAEGGGARAGWVQDRVQVGTIVGLVAQERNR